MACNRAAVGWMNDASRVPDSVMAVLYREPFVRSKKTVISHGVIGGSLDLPYVGFHRRVRMLKFAALNDDTGS